MIEKITAWVETGIITTRVISVAILSVVIYMWLTGNSMPVSLDWTWKIIIGYWFGTEGMKVAFEKAKEAYYKEHELLLKKEQNK